MKKHCLTAVHDLLHVQLGSHIRIVAQTQRVKSLAIRVHQIKVTSTEWTTVHTVTRDGTHRNNLVGQHGMDELGAHQHGGTHVVQAMRLEDHGTSLEPHTFAGTIVAGRVRLQELRGQALESTQHSPAILQHLSLAEALEGFGVCCMPSAVPTVVTRVLTGQVVRDVAARNVRAHFLRSGPYQADTSTLGAVVFFFPAAANMAKDGVHSAAISRVNLFAANGSAMWEAQFSTGPLPVTAACTKQPNMESIAKRPFLISFTFNPAATSGSSAKPRGANHLPSGYTKSRSRPPNGPPFSR